jgi:hypothetical protein
MLNKCMRGGLRTTWSNRRLVALLWIWNLSLAAVAALPVWQWWKSAFDLAPETDRLLVRFEQAVIHELAQYDRSPVWSLVLATSFAAIAVAVLGNAFVNGGTIEVLEARESKPLLHRFCRGGGRFFLRFLGLLGLSGAAALASLGVVALIFRIISFPFKDSGSEVLPLALGGLQAACAAAVAAALYIALDYARIGMAAGDSRSILRSWVRGLRFLLNHAGRAFGLLAAAAAAGGILFAVYAVFRESVPSNTFVLIWIMIVAQQLFVAARIGLRTALLGAELELYATVAPPVEIATGPVLPETPTESCLVAADTDPLPAEENQPGESASSLPTEGDSNL